MKKIKRYCRACGSPVTVKLKKLHGFDEKTGKPNGYYEEITCPNKANDKWFFGLLQRTHFVTLDEVPHDYDS